MEIGIYLVVAKDLLFLQCPPAAFFWGLDAIKVGSHKEELNVYLFQKYTSFPQTRRVVK